MTNQLQNLLHDALLGTNHVEKCAFINVDEHSIKAASIGFQINHDDLDTLIDVFDAPHFLRDKGLDFENMHYNCIRADENAIYAKEGGRGLVIVKTHSHILLGTFKEGMYPSVCVEAVEKLGKNLSVPRLCIPCSGYLLYLILADYFKQKGK